MDDLRARRVAANEAAARRINESIDDERVSKGEPGPRWLICECAEVDCAELLDVGPSKHHEVRSNPRRFIVMPGHQEREFEIVVESTPAYLVVEKTDEAEKAAS